MPLHSTSALPSLLAGTLLALSAAPAAPAQGLVADGNEFRVSAASNYSQYWVRVSADAGLDRLAFSFNSGLDVWARFYDRSGAPLGPDLPCNPNLTNYIQDEAEVCLSEDGHALVAWSERHGYDGEEMGIFGRIFDPQGAPLGPEFQVNEAWQASQWRPLIEPRPGSGWVVSWSADWDGDAVFRLLDSDGSFLSPDVRVNTFDANAQVDTTHAVAPDGTMLLVFVDYSAHAGIGTGTNLWKRLFDAAGTPIDLLESPVNEPAFTPGEQREPRVAADGLGRFVVVWEDQVADGSGWGIIGRRFDAAGVPLGPEFVVNQNTTGDQRHPRVAADATGCFLVAWEDRAAGSGSWEIKLRRFDAAGIGDDELVANQTVPGDQQRPSLDVSADGEDVIVCWDGPGTSQDAYARFFTVYQDPAPYCLAKTNSQGCLATIGWTGTPSLSGPDDFHVTASEVINQRTGLLFWGYAPLALLWKGGTRCVQSPLVRTPLQDSGGTAGPNDCSGTYDFTFTQGYMLARGWVPGDTIYAQYWYRDPISSFTVGLSDALTFQVRD